MQVLIKLLLECFHVRLILMYVESVIVFPRPNKELSCLP